MRKGLFVLFGIFAGGAIALDRIQANPNLRGITNFTGAIEDTASNIVLETPPMTQQFNELVTTAVPLKQAGPRRNADKFLRYSRAGFETTEQALELEINPRLKVAFETLVKTNAIEGMSHHEKLEAMVFCFQFAGNAEFPSYNNDEVLATAKKLLKHYKEYASDKHNLSEIADFEQYADVASGLENSIKEQEVINKESTRIFRNTLRNIAT